MTVQDRLKLARERAGFESATEAATRFGWAPPTYMAHENGSRGLTRNRAADYARAFKVSPEWLLFGVSSEKDAESFSDRQTGTLVDVFDVRASAGYGAINDQELVVDRLAFPPGYLQHITSTSPRYLSIISVQGDSMEPTLKNADLVMVDRSKANLDYDGLFVLRFGDALHIKRIARGPHGMVRVVADNPTYPSSDQPRSEITVVGRVIWTGKKV